MSCNTYESHSTVHLLNVMVHSITEIPDLTVMHLVMYVPMKYLVG